MEANDPVLTVTTTTSTREEAEMMAQRCVEEGFAACAQVAGPLTSIYRWQGEMHNELEWKISFKTFGSLEARLSKMVRELHSYDVPEILSTRAEGVSEDYLDWMTSNLK